MPRQTRWVARLTPTGDMRVEALLSLGYSLDVWEIEGGDATRAPSVIAAADEEQLTEVERVGHARVERLSPLEGYGASDAPSGGRS